jgi:hypothetical protein
MEFIPEMEFNQLIFNGEYSDCFFTVTTMIQGNYCVTNIKKQSNYSAYVMSEQVIVASGNDRDQGMVDHMVWCGKVTTGDFNFEKLKKEKGVLYV